MSDRLLEHIHSLTGERHPVSTPTALRQAEDYLTTQFRHLGLQVSHHAFDAYGSTYRNVVASLHPAPVKSGTAADGSQDAVPLIIAAHYDTVLGSPGADDNASGLAVMLEVAGKLVGAPLGRSVRFIGFCLEEDNLLGSLAYASALRAAGEEIRGALVLECVGYTNSAEGSQLMPPGVPIAVPSVGDFLGIVGNTASAELVTCVEHAARHSGSDLKTVSLLVPGQGELLPDSRRSDHAAFWYYGYPAVMLTDTANFRNPHYHQPSDTAATLDFSFTERVVEAVTAAAIELAGPK